MRAPNECPLAATKGTWESRCIPKAPAHTVYNRKYIDRKDIKNIHNINKHSGCLPLVTKGTHSMQYVLTNHIVRAYA